MCISTKLMLPDNDGVWKFNEHYTHACPHDVRNDIITKTSLCKLNRSNKFSVTLLPVDVMHHDYIIILYQLLS